MEEGLLAINYSITLETEKLRLLPQPVNSDARDTLIEELGYDISDQNTIYTDSQSAIALAHNPEHHARTKHIDIQYHFIRSCVEDGTTRLEYCPTEDMTAAGLTT